MAEAAKGARAVLLGNHQTELDVLVLGHLFPRYCSVTAKKSLMYVPILGWFSKYILQQSSPRVSLDCR